MHIKIIYNILSTYHYYNFVLNILNCYLDLEKNEESAFCWWNRTEQWRVTTIFITDTMAPWLTSIPALMFSNLLLPIRLPSLDGEKDHCWNWNWCPHQCGLLSTWVVQLVFKLHYLLWWLHTSTEIEHGNRLNVNDVGRLPPFPFTSHTKITMCSQVLVIINYTNRINITYHLAIVGAYWAA